MTVTAPTRLSVLWLPFIPFAILSIVHVTALALGNSALAAPTKLGLMPLLALAVLLNSRRITRTAPIALLLIAIFFSWLGDGAGTFLPFLPTLPMMLTFFGIAHLAYILLFTRHVAIRRMPIWSLVFIGWWIAMMIVIGPHTGDLLIAVGIYGLLLGATAACSTRGNTVILVGGLFFLLSDSLLAFLLFRSDIAPDWTDPAVMLTYTLGQGLIALGVVLHVRKQSNAGSRR